MSLVQRVWNVFKSRRVEQELEEEIEFHLHARTQQYVKEGMTHKEARGRARLEFGNVTAFSERARDHNLLTWLEIAFQDVRYSFRQLCRHRGFTVVSLASLVLGIGATAALFSVVDAVVWQPLSLPNSQDLVQFRESRHDEQRGGAPARLKDFRSAHSFVNITGFYEEGATLQKVEGAIRLTALRTFGAAGATLGVRPVLGRTFTFQEETGNAPPVALISYQVWKNYFGGTDAVLGRTLRLGKEACTIVGVLPQNSQYPENVDLWAPAPALFQNLDRAASFLEIVGRLAPGVTLTQASSEMRIVDAHLAKQYPATDANIQTSLVSLQAAVVQEARAPLLTLLGAVGAVLMVACVNIAGLMLSRVWAQQRESTIRVALGAPVSRLVRLRLIEVSCLAAVGGWMSIGFAYFSIQVLKVVLPQDLPRLSNIHLNGHVVVFTLVVTIFSALLAGLPPAWQEAQAMLAHRLKEGSAGSVGAGKRTLRSVLVTGQVALSMLLLICAALLAHSLFRLQQVHLGFRPERTIAMTTAFSWDTPDSQIQHFTGAVLERLAALPGVSEAGIVDRLPLKGGAESAPIVIRGRELDPNLARQSVGIRTASAGYFRALHVPLLSGTLFPDRLDTNGPRLVVVNERFAKRYFPRGDVVGQLLKTRSANKTVDDKDWCRIVGVVGDIRTELRESNPMPEIYRMWGQSHWPIMAFVLRTSSDPMLFMNAMRKVAAQVDPDQPLLSLQPLTKLLPESAASSRLQTGLLSGFAGGALLLAAVGLYGLLSGEVTRRTSELGVRLALGAEPADLLWMELQRGMRLVMIGLVLGSVSAIAATRLLRSLLFEIGSNDLFSILVAAVVLTSVGLAACWLPSRRASRIDPLLALRQE